MHWSAVLSCLLQRGHSIDVHTTRALANALTCHRAQFELAGGCFTFDCERGVRQGSVESPFLFSWLIDTKLGPLRNRWDGECPRSPWGVGLLSFADDTYLLASSFAQGLRYLNEVEHAVGGSGLELQPLKLQVAYNHAVDDLEVAFNALLPDNLVAPGESFRLLGVQVSLVAGAAPDLGVALGRAWSVAQDPL